MLLGTAKIFAGARINLDDFADTDEGRHCDFQAGFQRGWFVLSGGRRALDGRFGLDHLQLDRRWQFQADRFPVVERDLGVLVLFEIENHFAGQFRAQGDLVVSLLVHEHVVVALFVEVLHWAFVEVRQLDFIIRPETPGRHGARLQVFELQVQNGAPVSRRVQVAVHHGVELAVFTDDDHALSHLAVVDRGHTFLRLLTAQANTEPNPTFNLAKIGPSEKGEPNARINARNGSRPTETRPSASDADRAESASRPQRVDEMSAGISGRFRHQARESPRANQGASIQAHTGPAALAAA